MAPITGIHAPAIRSRRHLGSELFSLLTLAAAVATAALVLYPLYRIVLFVFNEDAGSVWSIVSETASLPGIGATILNTVVLVVLSSVLAVAAALVFAWLNERTDARIGVLAGILPILPLLIPSVAGAIGWTFLLTPSSGFVNVALRFFFPQLGTVGPFSIFNWGGLIALSTVNLIPYAYLILAAAFRNVDPALEEVSRVSGRGAWYTFAFIAVPSILPSIAIAIFVVVVVAIALFSVPVVVGGPAGIEVLSVKIVKLLNATYPPKLGVVVVLGFGMMVVLGILTVAQRKLAQRGHFKISGKNFSPRQIPLRRGRRAAQIAILTYVMVTSVIPFVGLLIVSLQPFWSPVISSLTLQNYSGLFTGSSLIGDALRRSLVLGAFAGAIGVGLCILLVSFVQDTRGFLRNATMFVVQMPAALSHIIIAIGLILAFTGRPFFLSGTAAILLIAYVLMYLPQSYAATSSAFSQMSKELVEASSVSGASRLRTLLMVEMPLAAPGMIAGWTMLFVMAISDLTASTMLASTRNAVIGSTILSLYETGTYPQLAALATLVTIISAALIAVIMRVQRRYSPF